MIEKLTVKSQLVCDPMMGEGATTALASRILERRFIGIEKDSARLRKAKAIIRNFKPSSLYE
jgi:DNA modification methylase